MNIRKAGFIVVCCLSGIAALTSGIICIVEGPGHISQIVLFGIFLGFALVACIMYNYQFDLTPPIITNV